MIFNRVSFDKKGFKYKNDDEKVKSLRIWLPEMSGYAKLLMKLNN